MGFGLVDVSFASRALRCATVCMLMGLFVGDARADLPAASGTSPSDEMAAEKEAVAAAPDILMFRDGDRVRGKLVGRDGDSLVFQSTRFGELRVPADSVQVIPASGSGTVAGAASPAPAEGPAAPPSRGVESEDGQVVHPASRPVSSHPAIVEATPRPSWTSPAGLALALRDLFGPWEGRVATTASLLTNTAQRTDIGANLSFKRKWERDEAKVDFQYDLAKTEAATDTNLLKGSGSWRHEMPGPWFVSYRPKLEWNRDYFVHKIDSSYFLLQDEIGIGLNVVEQEHRKVRCGLAEDVFDVWTLADGTHTTRDNQSLFGEIEFGLPWRITLADRGTWYDSVASGDHGSENSLELSKKFNDTLSLGLRQEHRRNSPDVRVSDYTLWRLQVGLDF